MRITGNICAISRVIKFFVVFYYDIDTSVLPRTKIIVESLWLLLVYPRTDHVAYSPHESSNIKQQCFNTPFQPLPNKLVFLGTNALQDMLW